MNRTASCLVLFLVASYAVAAPDAPASPFDRLKKLAGTWEMKMPDGKASVMEIRPVSAGSALMQTQADEGEGTMVTMIHPDGGRILLTHYCSAKNQPRMVAEIMPDGKTIKFNFLDITNLTDPAAAHMRHMVLTIQDEDHITQQWFFRKDGKEQAETFHYVRKK